MANQQGLGELLSLWNRFREDPDGSRFARPRTKWRSMFRYLHDIRRWGPQDRLAETGFADELSDLLPEAQETVSAEIELWYRSDATARRNSRAAVQRLVEESMGHLIGESDIYELRYHAVLAEIPLTSAREIIEYRGPIVNAGHVLDIRPVGQTVSVESDTVTYPCLEMEEPNADGRPPVVAVLDGLPIQDHSALAGSVVVDDPDGWEGTYPVSARRHGTAMSSLILRGDLSRPGRPSRPVYVRPILRPDLRRPDLPETLPRDSLPVDLVYGAIRRLFERSPEGGPVAPSVRIINHSVADRRREFVSAVGAWARLLDYVSWKYNVLVIVPTGNCLLPLHLAGVRPEDLTDGERLDAAAMLAVARTPWARRLLSPAEGINVLTVGASHADFSGAPVSADLVDPVQEGRPSPMSRHGPGYRRSIKPEIMLPGGRLPYGNNSAALADVDLVPRDTSLAPGTLVALP